MDTAPLPRRVARIALAMVAAIALLEWIVSAVVYRQALTPEDWSAASIALAELPPDEPVWLGTPWLAPRARLHLPRLARWDSVAPPDLRNAPRFHVLGLGNDDWSPPLAADLEDLPAPTLLTTRELGGLTLFTYEQPAARTKLADFVADAEQLVVETKAGSCRGRDRKTCEEGRVGVTIVEVGYRPRRCLKLEFSDGATLRMRYPQMPTGQLLRGHVGVDDFNTRLRSDSPLRVRVLIDGRRVAQWLVSDEQGWWPFAVATSLGTHDVELELSPAVRGTWQRRGYEPGRIHAPCIELRSLGEGPP